MKTLLLLFTILLVSFVTAADPRCFMPDQLISMADNTFKEIVDITEGELVKVYDTKTNQVKISEVEKIVSLEHSDVYELHLENKKILKPTGNHPFLTKNKGWTTIDGHNPNHGGGSETLELGDSVLDIYGGWIKVTKIVFIEGTYLTYNFVDMETNTVIADDIVTHNTGGGDCICTDHDGDGYYPTSCQDSDCQRRTDCNDYVYSINPGATEVNCNNIDEDCSGGPASPTGASDDDGDGYSDNDCSGSSGTGDCDDTNSGINPGIAEVVCNSIDENCNGMTDDTLGVGTSCGTTAVGTCSFGTNQCISGSLTCVGAINPETSDTCNDGLDTNCDGTDGFIEVCNNQDDDCNGSVDEGLTGNKTVVDVLENCEVVETICYDGFYSYDTALYSEPPTYDTCYDVIDNNCDGSIDEDCDFSLITNLYTGQIPSDNRYCTGSYGGSWIDDLNPAVDTDFEDFTAYGQYKFACEAQGSFYWSGERCCGSNTKFYKDSDSIILFKEYFADKIAGCFRGKPVPHDWTVGKALNNELYNDLLFLK